MKQKSIHLNISKLKQNTWPFLCLLIITIVFLCLGIRKDIWFCDKVYTYESAKFGKSQLEFFVYFWRNNCPNVTSGCPFTGNYNQDVYDACCVNFRIDA